jgi:subtilisin family serine protease
MKNNNYPIHYFIYLVIALILSCLFWYVVLKNYSKNNNKNIVYQDSYYWQQEYLPKEIGKIIPIDKDKIIIDTTGNKQIISNIVNIALKEKKGSIAKLAHDFKKIYNSNSYKIVYIDSVVNRLQIELPSEERMSFKNEVKNKLPDYQLLVWDESIFTSFKKFSDPLIQKAEVNWYLQAINIEKIWDKTTGKPSIIVAVIDNGFDLNHPELIDQTTLPYNSITKNKDVKPNKQNHGTHVASTIASKGNNGQGIVGICPDCLIMPIKVEDDNGLMSNSYIIDAILYAVKNNADVINLSLGMYIPLNTNITIDKQKEIINTIAKDEEEFWNELFTFAEKNNTICVLAAGNSNLSTGLDPFQRSKNTILVGAFDINNNKTIFSNYGTLTTLYAPGTQILGAKPGNQYEFLEGTSMAAPIVSGVVALLKSKNKKITFDEVKKYLSSNTKQINNINQLYINSF